MSERIFLAILVLVALVAGWLALQLGAPPPEKPTVVERPEKPQPPQEPPKETPPAEQPKPEKKPEQPQAERPTPQPQTRAVKNPDVLVQAVIADVDTLDPVQAYDTASGEIIFNIYENLIAYDGPRIDRFVPQLATEVPSLENGLIEVRPDGTTLIRFPIRAGVKFHNGHDLTPEDAAYSFRRIMIHSHPDSPAWILLEDLLGVHDLGDLAEKVGDQRACEMVKEAVFTEGQKVVFKLREPSATFLARLAHGGSWGAITDKEFVIERGGWDENCARWREFYQVEKEKLPLHSVANGTGPFKLERWLPDEEIVLARNENYWRTPAQLSKVITRVVPEFGTRKLMLQQGDADIIEVDRQFIPQMEGLAGVRTIYGLPGLSNTTAFFNYDIPVEGNPNIGSGRLDGEGIPPDFFRDIHIRKAFNSSFNWKEYIEQVWRNEAAQARGPIPAAMPFFNPENPVYSYDPKAAEEHFRAAWNGAVWEKGFQFTIVYNEGNDQRRIAAEMLKDNVEALNPRFQIEVRSEPWPTFLDSIRARRVPIFIVGWLADFPDPHNFAQPYMHSQGSYGIRQSLSRIANYDDLILQAAKELDPQKRRQLYYELQRRAYEDAIDIFLVDPTERTWQRTWVDGWLYNPMWPGEARYFYLLSKRPDAQVNPQLLAAFPQAKLTQW